MPDRCSIDFDRCSIDLRYTFDGFSSNVINMAPDTTKCRQNDVLMAPKSGNAEHVPQLGLPKWFLQDVLVMRQMIIDLPVPRLAAAGHPHPVFVSIFILLLISYVRIPHIVLFVLLISYCLLLARWAWHARCLRPDLTRS